MHRNKTFAGIFLIFSIANVVLGAPASIRQGHFVTERADDEPTGDSKQDPAATPPPVGSPEKSLTLSDKQPLDYLANDHSSGDPERTVLPSSPFRHQGSSSPEQNPAGLVHEEVEHAATPPNHANYLLNENGKRPALPSSPYGSHQGSSLPEQDPAGLVHEEVKPAATPPPVGSQSRPEKLPTMAKLLSDQKKLDYLTNFLLYKDPKRLKRPVPPSAPYGSHQGSSLPESVSGNTESLHTASHEQMLPPASVAQPLPPASVAQPLHNDAHESVESNSFTDMDEASTMSSSSRVSGWEEEEAKSIEEVHPHL